VKYFEISSGEERTVVGEATEGPTSWKRPEFFGALKNKSERGVVKGQVEHRRGPD